jgi:hypothetical protein
VELGGCRRPSLYRLVVGRFSLGIDIAVASRSSSSAGATIVWPRTSFLNRLLERSVERILVLERSVDLPRGSLASVNCCRSPTPSPRHLCELSCR